ncbi:hypothetical protein ABUE34_05325 [Kozakia baliensis]|uniref:hypothetical protein n=1 Tax=Kozakia baliensis TaxID=153496 RepID=UPI00345C4C82
MFKHRFLWVAALSASFLLPQTSYGWGGRAHSVIDQTAIDAIPADGPVFLKRHVALISQSASIPDTWRASSEPFSKIAEDPNHGWFREQFAFMKIPPRSRYEFILALYREHERLLAANPAAASRMNVRWTGTLPYAVVEGYGHLVADMRLIREMKAKSLNTNTLETDVAFMVAWMGHYVGDGSQPLHVTIHHDGWVGPNPKNYTRNPVVHGRFESRYADMIALDEADLRPRLGAVAHQNGDVFNEVISYLDRSHQDVEKVYALDKSGALDDPKNPKARELIYERTAAAAAMLRDLVCRAWHESALPPEVNNSDSTNPSSPGYDSATGSVPAALSRPPASSPAN